MNKADYEGMRHNMRPWQWADLAHANHAGRHRRIRKKLTAGSSRVGLREPEGVMLPVLQVEESGSPIVFPTLLAAAGFVNEECYSNGAHD